MFLFSSYFINVCLLTYKNLNIIWHKHTKSALLIWWEIWKGLITKYIIIVLVKFLEVFFYFYLFLKDKLIGLDKGQEDNLQGFLICFMCWEKKFWNLKYFGAETRNCHTMLFSPNLILHLFHVLIVNVNTTQVVFILNRNVVDQKFQSSKQSNTQRIYWFCSLNFVKLCLF